MLKVGLFGLGTVGQGLLEISRNSKLPFEIVAIVDRSYKKKSKITGNIAASDNPSLILDDNDIDLVVELMGGIDLPLFIIREALDKKKNVITANKFLLAEHGFALFTKAQDNGVKIGFEAAVAGAIPVIRNLENIFWYEDISLLEGILNGTTNYILTKMRTEKKEYEYALKDAQKLGFAEADPTLDVSGMDAAHKLALLASHITKSWIEYKSIYVRGIENIRLNDILWTEKAGYRIRLISRCQRIDGKVYLSVEPSIILPGHYLWDVENENNAIVFQGMYSGIHMFVGKGAGSLPTAYSVLSDIMHITQGNHNPYLMHNFVWRYNHPGSVEDKESAFYMRLLVMDEPGVLADIAKVLSEHSISIASVHQDAPIQISDHPVDLILITHKCLRKSLQTSITALEKLNSVKSVPVFLPIDEN
ncbi:MAG: homoserine dehydrogenase [Spirochaetia bacterium]|nr:homoserine dehydrogenase [Spirochaetia bacterium]